VSKKKLTEFEVGMRLDKTVAAAYPEYSRSSLEKLIENGDILVNGQIKSTGYKLKTNDVIELDLSAYQKRTDDIDLPIIYEDDDVIVINKPEGVLTHSKGEFNQEGTVAIFLKQHAAVISSNVERSINQKESDLSTGARDDETQDFWDSNRAGIVHRLDRGTSGVIICAKNKRTEDYLKGQFSKRNVKKTYVAVIAGQLNENEGLIDVPIERNPKKPATFRPGINGKPAQTNFKVISFNGIYSMVELKPITGRTHQLRVHLNFLNHPIVGDDFYGGEKANRLMLHALKLELTLPSGERRVFNAPLPSQFNKYN